MFLTIESECPGLSFLLHKHPDKRHSTETSFGQAHVYYPKENQVALLLEVDPLGLTKRGGAHPFALKPYVNDRGYVANSLLSVALNQLFRTAMAGRCEKRPELVEQENLLEVVIPSLPSRGGEALLRRLFGPLGYEIEATAIPLDEEFPEWGLSHYYHTVLRLRTTVYRLLRHLYILIPVLDNEKHYWVGKEEVQKLIDKGEEWLSDHPEKDLIANRYLKHQRGLAQEAMKALSSEPEVDFDCENEEEAAEQKTGLNQLRLKLVAQMLLESGARKVADLGCGEGKLIRHLLKENQFSKIVAMDVSLQALAKARANIERAHESKRKRVEIFQGSLLFEDARLKGMDAACLVEVIEHLEPDILDRVAQNLFQRIQPKTLIITTPNRDYNAVWGSLPAGKFRHHDHRFEWSRAEFESWASKVKQDYSVSFSGVGELHPEYGHPTQIAVFSL